MAYDQALVEQVQAILGDRPGVTSKRMFGGLAMLVNGNMAVVVRGEGGLMVRIDPADQESLLAAPGVETTVMRGRPLSGWLTVAPHTCAEPSELRAWVGRGLAYALTLPARATPGKPPASEIR